RKTAAKKPVAKKAATTRAATKKTAARKTAAKKATARKATARKATARNSARKPITPKKALANTRKLLDSRQQQARMPPPWQQLGANPATQGHDGYQSPEAAD